MGMQTSNKAAATFDSTYGWLMTAWTSAYDYYDFEQYREVLKYTTNGGKSFGEFPALEDNWLSADCLETLDNGGDIIAITSFDIFIFHGNTSTWENKISNLTIGDRWVRDIAGMYHTKQ